jgi:anaerobic magnesium-protoporphyrin IX monomethyl ester cyclase
VVDRFTVSPLGGPVPAGRGGIVKVLLLSMPDSSENLPSFAIRMPNGALTSLAANVDAHHEVVVADLILAQDRVGKTVEQLVRKHDPDLVGLSIMTFQRRTARRIIRLVRSLKPDVRIVAGGYDPSLARDEYTGNTPDSADFIVRGEGEITFRELLRSLETRCGFESVAGLSYRDDGRFLHNPDRTVCRLEEGAIRPPSRKARVLNGYTLLGRQIDVVETSRGCTYDCNFCSIIEMRGRNFQAYTIDRVLSDIRDAREHGARAIFLVDDNITLNVRRFADLCRAIVDAGLNNLTYIVQAMTSALADHGEELAPLMHRAGVYYVFLGIENILEDDLKFLGASSKTAQRENGRTTGNAAVKAIENLHRNKIYVVGGMIVGNPDDTRESMEANLEFARQYVDWPHILHPTPYPGTAIAEEFRRQGLIIEEHPEEFDGTTAIIRSKHLPAEELEFMRWRAERGIKTGHFGAALAKNPWFVLRKGRVMLAYTYRGSTWRTFLGLEDEREAFRRYRAIRKAERARYDSIG